MKKLFKIIGGFVAFIVIVLFAAFYLTSALPRVADDFFTAIKNNDIDKAYSLTTADFKSTTSKEKLKQYLSTYSFDKYKDSSWSSRSIENNKGKLIGSITTESGSVLPLTINFVKTNDGWRISYLQKSKSGLKEKVITQNVPPEKELIKLVSETMILFGISVSEGDMKRLREASSLSLQKSVSLEKFNSSYQTFFKFKDNILKLTNEQSPSFSEKASINSAGILSVKGYYLTKTDKFTFALGYVFEGYGWKLKAIKSNISPRENSK